MTEESVINDIKPQESIYPPISIQSYREYLERNVSITTISASLIGAARGYYVGEATALYFYSNGFAAGVGFTAFFTGTYLLRQYREKDDMTGYGLSGAINGSWISAGLTNGKKIPHGIAAGAIFGATFFHVYHYTYKYLRDTWIYSRREGLTSSRSGKFVNKDIPAELLPTRQPRFPTFEPLSRRPPGIDNNK